MCGNCIFRKYIDGEWICDNEESENYGLETGYSDDCLDCEEKSEVDL